MQPARRVGTGAGSIRSGPRPEKKSNKRAECAVWGLTLSQWTFFSLGTHRNPCPDLDEEQTRGSAAWS